MAARRKPEAPAADPVEEQPEAKPDTFAEHVDADSGVTVNHDGDGYHGQAAVDRGHKHKPEDVGSFADHISLDAGVTVHHGDTGPAEVTTQ